MSLSVSYAVPSCGSRRDSMAGVRESGPAEPPKPRLLDRVRAALRIRHYSRRTEEARVAWIRQYILLPEAIKAHLARHLERVRDLHRRDLQAGAAWVGLPTALGRKYPNAGREWVWQWVFPATRMYRDRATRQLRRHHLHESVLQRTVKVAVFRAGLAKRATPHTLRHSFATSAPPRSAPTCSTAGPPLCGARSMRCSAAEDLDACRTDGRDWPTE